MTTTFRNAIFQLHWFFGITAGIVLALVGVTGAMLSFEDAALKALNPAVMTVTPRGTPLAPNLLIARIRSQAPQNAVQSLTLSSDPGDAARVGFAPKADAPRGPGGRGPRGESRYADPYSGTLLEKPRGEGFFRTTMQVHRWLAVDDVGKQIVGFSTVVLIFFCLSGLYLRWPRKALDWRAWLKLDTRQKGRNFLWHLHSIVGTWVLLAYLLMSLTGLWWSYEWYRNGLNAFAGMPQQSQQRPGGGKRGTSRDAGSKRASPLPEASTMDVAAAWRAFETTAPAWSTATLQWPRDGGGVKFRYLDADPPHERASNELELDAATLAVVKHERYGDKPAAQRVVGSIFALHRGSYFGLAGVVLFMFASLLMPLFAVTGWMLYLDRRGKNRAARSAEHALTASAVPLGEAPIVIAYASQTGSAERIAWQTAASLRDAGMAVSVQPLGQLDAGKLANATRILFVVSTFGDGQPPDNARAFARKTMAKPAPLSKLQYGVLSLGDASYETYCGFGRALDSWLHHNSATPLFDRIDVDNGDTGALRHWQHHLGVLSGHTELPDWTAPRYDSWRLSERRILNPGSSGHPAIHVALTPPVGMTPGWQAGDIVEIGPRHDPDAVARYLAETGLDGSAPVRTADGESTLHALLVRSILPDPATLHGSDAQTVADGLKALPHREYSIASLPQDGRIEVLVRQFRRPDGQLGLGAGWLTASAPIGADIAARLRTNSTFHAPEDECPLLLIGNGTGIAGLRALLKLRAQRNHHRNWLVFGERHREHDAFYGDELEAWRASGVIERLDLAFSRDTHTKTYVQHVLTAAAADVRAWIDAGAAIYVCGSLQGMAPGVDAALSDILGVDALEALAESGRYRRDVY